MIHTFDEAEFPLPDGLVPPGQRAYVWAELALQIPYFLVSLEIDDPDCSRTKHLFCTNTSTVLKVHDMLKVGVRVTDVSVLCPGYMTNAGTYTMEQIVEIWESPSRPDDQVYLTKDGRKLRFCIHESPTPDLEMQCVLRLANCASGNTSFPSAGSTRH